MSLPKFISLIFNGKNLEYIETRGDLHGFLRFSADKIVSPYTKFEVERSNKSEELVHLRSCYNNKYLVRRSENEDWIVAAANEPEEDQSKWSSTLFRPVLIRNDQRYPTYGFQMTPSFGSTVVWLNSHRRNPVQPKYRDCLVLMGLREAIQIEDMEKLAILPQHFTLKGDNGKYLKAHEFLRKEYLQFSADKITDPPVRYEAVINSQGNVQIRSKFNDNKFFNKFWRRIQDVNSWILAEATQAEAANDQSTVFWPIRVHDNVIALINMANGRYCKRLTSDRRQNCLSASARTLESLALFRLEELVRSRRIDDVRYRTEDARIYDLAPRPPLIKEVINRSQTQTAKGEVHFTYSEIMSESWNSTHSWKVEVSTTISAGIPILVGGQISISTSYEGQYTWGKIIERKTEMGTALEVNTPPMSKTIVTMIVHDGNIDVPFSYTQHDVLLDGTPVIPPPRLHDGIFSGASTYVIYDIREESLSSTSLEAPSKL